MGQSKGELRQRMASLRQALSPEEHGRRSSALVSRILGCIRALGSPGVLALYAPSRGEVDLMPLLGAAPAAGWSCAFPRVEGQKLVFHLVRDASELEKGAFGILEPRRAAPLAEPSVVLTPGLAFSRDFHRIGYGKGFYDRALADLRKTTSICAVGACFDFQLVESLPQESHDQELDCVLTEAETLVRARP